MAANQRIYFAIQGLAVKPDGVEAWGEAWEAWDASEG